MTSTLADRLEHKPVEHKMAGMMACRMKHIVAVVVGQR